MTDDNMTSEKVSQYVSFVLDREEYGIEIEKVQEIIRYPEITRLPQMPEFIHGAINLRGKVVLVMNLRKRFGLAEKEYDEKQRIIVVEIEQKITGIIVDAVSEVLDIEQNQIAMAPDMGSKVQSEYIKSMAKLGDNRLLILLNIESILNSVEVKQ